MTDSDISFTIGQFCAAENVSRAFFFKMRRLNLGPEVLRVPGSNVVRITAEARRAWHARMAALAEQDVAKLEQRRRAEQASRAGKAAASSPRHVSKRARNPHRGA